MLDPRSVPVRFSNLKRMAQSPAHYFASLVQASEFKATPGMLVGLAVHAIVLGGELHIYEGERRGNDWKAFEAEHAASVSECDDQNLIPRIITRKEADRAQAIAAAVRRNRIAMKLIESGPTEHLVNWSLDGKRACRSHIDAHDPGRSVTELKVTVDANPERFERQAQRMGYLGQLAYYRSAINVSDAFTIAVEAKYPYPVTVQQLTDRALLSGEKSVRMWWEQLLNCEASGSWPEYTQSIVPLDVPDDDLELNFGDEEAA